jgi:hypothetical protein
VLFEDELQSVKAKVNVPLFDLTTNRQMFRPIQKHGLEKYGLIQRDMPWIDYGGKKQSTYNQDFRRVYSMKQSSCKGKDHNMFLEEPQYETQYNNHFLHNKRTEHRRFVNPNTVPLLCSNARWATTSPTNSPSSPPPVQTTLPPANGPAKSPKTTDTYNIS